MSRFALFLVVLSLLGAYLGYRHFHRDDERLRLDNLHWRAGGGEIQDGSVIDASRGVALSFSLRGCKPDSASMCKVEFRVDTQGPNKPKWQCSGQRRGQVFPLEMLGPVEFRKNSAITSLEMGAVATGFSSGSYECTVTAEDLRASKIVQNTIRFRVP